MPISRVRTMRVDFFQVLVNDGNGKLDELIASADAMTGENRTKKTGDRTIHLQTVNTHRSGITGELLRVDMNYVPLKAKLDGTTSEIQLAEDEGIGNTAAFKFDPTRSILALERNRVGPTRRAFEEYFEKFGAERVELLPVANKDVWERINEMSAFRTLTVRFASVAAESIIGLDDDALFSGVHAANKFNASMAEIRIGMGRHRGSMDEGLVSRTLKMLSGKADLHPDAIEKLVVEGKGEDDELSVVDLLACHLSYSADVQLDRTRRVSLETRLGIIDDGWRQYRQELAALTLPGRTRNDRRTAKSSS